VSLRPFVPQRGPGGRSRACSSEPCQALVMGRIVVLGGGVCGLATGVLLARDGHEVEVWERDPASAPSSIDEAWQSWDRRGVKQFRQPHALQARVKLVLEREFPDVYDKLVAVGAARVDPLERLPPGIEDRALRPGDERLVSVTARRPTVEHVFATTAENEPRLRVCRGVAALELTARTYDGLPHVTGVRTQSGEERFDLVVDAMGRSSPLPAWLGAIGAAPIFEEAEDSGFAYYTRFFRSRGGIPEVRTPGFLTPVGSFSILTLPGDRDTWSVTLYAASGDGPLKAFRHPDRWQAVVQACPLHTHWLDGEPISEMTIMAGVVDRRRRLSDQGRPLTTGVALVADSWACTNPSLARGLAYGLAHVARLRDTVRAHLATPSEFARAWDDVTETEFTPWYAATIATDRARLAEIRAFQRGGRPPEPADEGASIRSRLPLAATRDATAYRAFMEIVGCLSLPAEVFGRPEVIRAIEASTERGEARRLPGPDRQTLLALLA
jgi:2-polyprenyl-6-methoxyphenol hydroxylase-like FAD-dependent oxidoreductase